MALRGVAELWLRNVYFYCDTLFYYVSQIKIENKSFFYKKKRMAPNVEDQVELPTSISCIYCKATLFFQALPAKCYMIHL